MLEHSQSKQEQPSELFASNHHRRKTWFIPANCSGLNINEKYSITNKLYEDSLCVSYLVKQSLNNPNMGRFFQLKMYKPEILRENWIEEGVFEQIKNTLSLNSRLILSCYEYNEWNGIPYTIHEFFEWKTLENIIAERENKLLSTKFAVSCVIETLKALESLYANQCEFKHSKSFIHGNLAPNKIVISQDTGQVLLTDTGIIALYSRACFQNSTVLPIETIYLSPEQINFEPITIASDIFSVGLILLDLLTPLYRNRAKMLSQSELYEFLNSKLLEEINFFHLNEELLKLLKKALHPNETERYQTPTAFISDLNAYLRKQYWVFDIQENIKTVFYAQQEQDEPHSPHIEFNKTLVLSTPKELVNSVPLEELSHEIEKMTLPNFTQPSLPPKKLFSKKLIKPAILAAAAVLLTVIFMVKLKHSAKKLEPVAQPAPTAPIITTLAVPPKQMPVVQTLATAPAKSTEQKVKATAIEKHKTPPIAKPKIETEFPTKVVAAKTIPEVAFAKVSINAVPFATIEIPAAHLTGQITPLSNVKIPVSKSIVILVSHGNCNFRKVLNTEEKNSFDLRFNMYACKEY